MWIVKVALNRPYTFIVLALLILIAAPVVIMRTPTDIFPNINIPVVSIAWTYTGLNPEELEGRLTSPYEKALTTLVDNIQHIESTTYNGEAIVKVYLQPGASLDTANAQVTAASQILLRQLPPGTLPPQIINFSASSVPILQLGISGKGLSESQLNDYATNFIRTQLITVPGAVVPSPYGGKTAADHRQHGPGRDAVQGHRAGRRAERAGAAERGHAFGHDQDRPVGIRRKNQRSATHGGGTGECSTQAGQRHNHLSARCRQRQRRISGADQHRAPGRPPRRADLGSQERQCLDAGRGQGHSWDVAPRGEHGPAAIEDDAPLAIRASSFAPRCRESSARP